MKKKGPAASAEASLPDRSSVSGLPSRALRRATRRDDGSILRGQAAVVDKKVLRTFMKDSTLKKLPAELRTFLEDAHWNATVQACWPSWLKLKKSLAKHVRVAGYTILRSSSWKKLPHEEKAFEIRVAIFEETRPIPDIPPKQRRQRKALTIPYLFARVWHRLARTMEKADKAARALGPSVSSATIERLQRADSVTKWRSEQLEDRRREDLQEQLRLAFPKLSGALGRAGTRWSTLPELAEEGKTPLRTLERDIKHAKTRGRVKKPSET